jgi:threonine/homoserine/homoserine lactone efflux protein
VSLLVAAALGVALGVVTGMPLGAVNVAIVEAATAGRVRFAIGIGIGGALADVVHAGLAFAGVGRIVTERPDWIRAMAIAAACVLIGYAAVAWRATDRPLRLRASHGFPAGILITLPNPAALAAWVAVAAAVWPAISLAGALVLAAGVGLGSAAWFTLLARWIAARPYGRLRSIVARIARIALVAIAVAGIAHAFG